HCDRRRSNAFATWLATSWQLNRRGGNSMSFKDKFKSFFNTEEEYEYVEEYEEDTASSLPSTPSKDQKNVVNLSAIHQSTSKVMLCEPTSYNEVQEIADYILNKRAVVINLQNMDQHQAKRIIDFLSGTVYAVNGDIQKTGMSTFLYAPENIYMSISITQNTTKDIEFNKVCYDSIVQITLITSTAVMIYTYPIIETI